MSKTEHLQFLVLMIPTFLILIAAAVSMADLAAPATPETYVVTTPVNTTGDDRPAE